MLLRTVIISILAFPLFDCSEFFSEYQVLEVSRHTPLTDRLHMVYYELPKLPKLENSNDELELWLALFNAKTEEELKEIEELGGLIMEQAVGAYRQVTATDRFKEIERLRSLARHNEAAALRHAREERDIEIAKRLLEKQMPLADIMEVTGLTRTQVERLCDTDQQSH